MSSTTEAEQVSPMNILQYMGVTFHYVGAGEHRTHPNNSPSPPAFIKITDDQVVLCWGDDAQTRLDSGCQNLGRLTLHHQSDGWTITTDGGNWSTSPDRRHWWCYRALADAIGKPDTRWIGVTSPVLSPKQLEAVLEIFAKAYHHIIKMNETILAGP